VHVSASEFETLGNTVLEAHACSIPVVVPRTQGEWVEVFVWLILFAIRSGF
jgi:glycosyltransferase involved in cell wall biosynthesis